MSREIAERCLSILLEELSTRNEHYSIFKQAEKSVLLSRDFFGWEDFRACSTAAKTF